MLAVKQSRKRLQRVVWLTPVAVAVASVSLAKAAAADEDLMAELEAAEKADAAVTAANQPADREAEDPMNLLGQEVVGNETNPSISFILDFAGAAFSSDSRLRLGGHAPTSNGPAIQGAELSVEAPVDPFFEVFAAIGMYHGHVEEAYLTTTSFPLNLQLRAGKFKANIGRHNPTHLHEWNFVVHPVANQFNFGAEGLGLPGAELSVLLPLPWYVEIVGALQMGEAGAFRTKRLDQGDPGMADFIYPVRLMQYFDIGDDWGFQLGANTVQGTSWWSPETNNRTAAYGGDLFLKWRPIGEGRTGYEFIAWTVEGWWRQMQVPEDLWRDAGGYSDLVFGLSKEWQSGVRIEYWKRLQGDAPNEANTRGQFGIDMVRGSAMVSYLPSHFSRVRLQGSSENSELFHNNHTVLLQLEVAAGAHGAHEY